jgi:hypothetical protein
MAHVCRYHRWEVIAPTVLRVALVGEATAGQQEGVAHSHSWCQGCRHPRAAASVTRGSRVGPAAVQQLWSGALSLAAGSEVVFVRELPEQR